MLNSFRACLAGSGAGFFSTEEGASRLLQMTGRFIPGESTRVSAPVSIAYIGTATYDLDQPARQQLMRFVEMGCEIVSIGVADPSLKKIRQEDEEYLREKADIVLVSGGNTLYAIRRWEETGLDAVLRDISTTGNRKVILAGGSAGAICWFTSGHSDSADPSTYLKASLLTAAGRSNELDEESTSTNWSYIRVHGMNLLPGMLCPHFDTTQSNNVPRETDFKKMLKRHPTERGIAIDHWSALILNGDGSYEVFSVPNKKRENGEAGQPGVFTIDVISGEIKQEVVPRQGKVADILRAPNGPVVKDPFEAFYAMANSTPSSGSFPKR